MAGDEERGNHLLHCSITLSLHHSPEVAAFIDENFERIENENLAYFLLIPIFWDVHMYISANMCIHVVIFHIFYLMLFILIFII